MSKIERLKDFYGKGLYTKEQIHALLEKGKITAEEYTEITGDDNE